MIEARRQLRLTQEALPEAFVVRQLVAEQLQRHRSAVLQRLGEVDRAHGALADERRDAEAGDDVAGTELDGISLPFGRPAVSIRDRRFSSRPVDLRKPRTRAAVSSAGVERAVAASASASFAGG